MTKNLLVVILCLFIAACTPTTLQEQALPNGKPTLPQSVEWSSDKTTYLIGEDMRLQLKLSSLTQIDITAIELELYPEEVGYYAKQNQLPFEGTFERIEGPIDWTGTVTPNNPETIKYVLRPQKEGHYTIGALVNVEHGGKREMVTICVVSSLDRHDIICPQREKSARVPAIETNK